MRIEHWQLKQRQSLPLELKIRMSLARIRDWYYHYSGKVYVSFSGGMDSTVLLHLVRSEFPDVPAVFVKALPYPEILQHVKATENVIILKPKKTYQQVVEEYGWPVISKERSQQIYQVRTTKSLKLWHKRMYGDNTKWKNGKIPEKWKYLIVAPFKISHVCCDWLKKKPFHQYWRKTGEHPMLGTRVTESRLRQLSYKRYGCNLFESKKPRSWPLAFWKDKDIWEYAKLFNVSYSSIYDMGHKRTGCFACALGAHLEKEPNRFQMMLETHPKLWKYCEQIGLFEVLDYINVPYKKPEQMFLL